MYSTLRSIEGPAWIDGPRDSARGRGRAVDTFGCRVRLLSWLVANGRTDAGYQLGNVTAHRLRASAALQPVIFEGAPAKEAIDSLLYFGCGLPKRLCPVEHAPHHHYSVEVDLVVTKAVDPRKARLQRFT